MILLITERCWTNDFKFTKECYERTYEYVTATDDVVEALKNFIFEFDSDNVFNTNDIFGDECLNSEIVKIEVIQP
jgi:hypothetical protein